MKSENLPKFLLKILVFGSIQKINLKQPTGLKKLYRYKWCRRRLL